MASEWDKYKVDNYNNDSPDASEWDKYKVPEESEKPQQQEKPNRLQGLPFLKDWAESLQKHPGLQKFLGAASKNVAEPIVNAFEGAGYPQAIGGAIQGLGNTLSSVYNVAANPISQLTGINARAPKLDLRSNYPDNAGSDIAFGAGQLYGGGAGATGAFKGISGLSETAGAGKIAEGLKNISPELLTKIASKISPNILKGAATGGAISEDMPGGRGLGAAVGGIGGATGSAIPKALNFAKLNSKKIGEKILDKKNLLERGFGHRYNKLFDTAEKENITKLNIPTEKYKELSDDFNRIIKVRKKDETEALREFIKNPTIKNAQTAQSDFGKIERKISRAEVLQGDLLSSQNKTWDSISRARENLKQSIESTFNKSGKPELSKKYLNLTEDYAKELSPYLNSKVIRQYEAEGILPEDFAKKLSRDADFMNKKGADHPEIKDSIKKEKILKDLIKYGKILGIGGAAATGTVIGGTKLYNALTD